jgi:acyl-CoA synthetase (AMP-forming)/AMP-acid ligase II
MNAQARAPASVAEVVSWRVEGDLHRLTGAALTARARRVAGTLAAAGLTRGDVVAMLAWNGHRAVELALACAGAGIRLAVLDPCRHPDAIARSRVEAAARIVFFDLSFMPVVENIALRLAVAPRFVALAGPADMPGPAAIPDLLCYEALVASAPEGLACATRAPALFSLRPDDVVLAAAPMSGPEGSARVRAAAVRSTRCSPAKA